MGEKILKGERGILDHVSSTTGLSAWLIYEPVPLNGWSLNNTFIKSDIEMNVDSLRKQLVRICVVALLFLWSLASIVLGVHRGNEKRLWLMSAVTAVLFLAGIGYVWHLALSFNRDNDEDTVRITTQPTLNTLMNKYTEECAGRHTEPPVYIRTGIFLESVRLTGACDVAVSGFIWQTYSDSMHGGLAREFQIGDAQDVKVTEIYRHKEGDEEILRWSFQASLTEGFDDSEYPLNQETISIPLLHKDLNHNVVLVPDLRAYRVTSPTSLPGLEKDILVPGWTVMRSFFNFRKRTYDTDFGVERSVLKENFPALALSVVVRRNFLDSFVSCLTPLIVVALLLFSIFFLSTKDPEKIKLLGVSPGRFLGFCAGLFFVVVFSHIGTREAVSAKEIFYLEYFYLVMYLTLLWVSVNAILHILADKILFIQYSDNLISKLLYWPVLLALLFGITVVFFY
ncbi:MAG: hypothetical protein JSV84_09270 [Gemmatimonadota bacterium]|nr:MAG: hypothetical protein JSV84_09270 [Gemmatimonadota bacterium]